MSDHESYFDIACRTKDYPYLQVSYDGRVTWWRAMRVGAIRLGATFGFSWWRWFPRPQLYRIGDPQDGYGQLRFAVAWLCFGVDVRLARFRVSR